MIGTPPPDAARIQQLANGHCLETAHNLILVGGTGTGKTHLAIAPGAAAIHHGQRIPSDGRGDRSRADSGCQLHRRPAQSDRIAQPVAGGRDAGGTVLIWPFLICGALKISYAILLLAQFRHIKPPEEN